MIKDLSQDDELSEIEDEKIEDTIIDVLTGEEVPFPTIPPFVTGGGEIIDETNKRKKIYINGVEVEIVNERVQYLDNEGKIITETLKDYTKKNVLAHYSTLNSFLSSWNNAEKKKAIVQELEQKGILFDALKEEIGNDYDPFDLVCHVAFEAKPLTKKERANNVKKRNYFSKYGEKAQAVIQILLDKYADSDIFSIESLDVWSHSPINQHGRPLEIFNIFGGKNNYLKMLKELENELYKAA